MTNFLFTEEESNKLFDDNLSEQEQNKLLKKADERFQYIMKVSGEIIGRKWEWFDFITQNENSSRGYFCKDTFKNEIEFIGQSSVIKNYGFDQYDNCVPTNWLWTNFEEALKKEVEQFEKKNEITIKKFKK
jgi:hypothetical protein